MAETAELRAGRELDEAVGREVMGWTLVGILWRDASGRAIHTVSIDYDDSDGEFPAFLPSTDIAAAFEVVAVMRSRGWMFTLMDLNRDGVVGQSEMLGCRLSDMGGLKTSVDARIPVRENFPHA